MCGVTGIFNLNGEPVSAVVLRAMTNQLIHRGPDSEGYYTDSFIGLGHRRLAIIDLAASGHQPMITPDGRFVISYNGEIYNYAELKRELVAQGRAFISQSDTEVLLHAWAEWGPATLDRLNGMFAFAIWDKVKCELVLARDRYGVKPLYYTQIGRHVLFASEVKSFIPHPSFTTAMDTEALVEYLTFQNYFTDRTLFRGVSILPAGNYLRIQLGAQSVPNPTRYWDYSFGDQGNELSEGEAIGNVEHLFRQAVKRQLVSDVPVNGYLSGGLDTGSITAVASNYLVDMKTFTIGFDLNSLSGLELSFDERSQAEYMSYLFKTEHYEMVLKAGDMERCMSRLIWHLEEPRVGQSYPNFYAAQLAGRFGKVVLAGTGGDEIFAGYPWRYYRAVVNLNFDQYIDKYFSFWQRIVSEPTLSRLMAPVWSDARHVSTREIFKNVFPKETRSLQRPDDYINHSLYLEARTFLHGLLVMEDKLSMAHGLETRVPFLDNDLVDFGIRIPNRFKLGHLGAVVELNENVPGDKTKVYFQKTKDGKLVLRNAMERVMPKVITGATKQGFSGPDASWFKGDSIDYVRRTLLNPRALIYDYLDPSIVEQCLQDHFDGRENRRLFIWSLLSLEEWCRTFSAPCAKLMDVDQGNSPVDFSAVPPVLS